MEPRLAGGFDWQTGSPAPALVCRPLLDAAPHFFTTSSWLLGSASNDRGVAWAQVARAAGVASDRLVHVRQVHRADALVVRENRHDEPDPLVEADIIATDDPGVAIAVQAADCAPILIADRSRGVVAAAHAGWRGLAAHVPSATVRVLAETWGSRPQDLSVAVGPSIGVCCYQVGRDVRDRFESAGFGSSDIERWFSVEHTPGRWRFDGWMSARDQLTGAGVPAAHVHVSRVCTGCHSDRFCSYRKQGRAVGRMVAAIRARKPA